MATVGEMVSKRAEAMVSPGARVEFPHSLPTDRAVDDLLIQSYGATIAAIRDLGIWDAEVLEGHQYGEEIVLDTVVPVTTPLDRPVRVIVLPKGAMTRRTKP